MVAVGVLLLLSIGIGVAVTKKDPAPAAKDPTALATLNACDGMVSSLGINRNLDSGNQLFLVTMVMCQADVTGYTRCLSLDAAKVASLNSGQSTALRHQAEDKWTACMGLEPLS